MTRKWTATGLDDPYRKHVNNQLLNFILLGVPILIRFKGNGIFLVSEEYGGLNGIREAE